MLSQIIPSQIQNSFEVLTFSQISELTGAALEPADVQGEAALCRTLAFATQCDVSFCVESSAYGATRTTKAAIVFVTKDFNGWAGEAKALARVENPYGAIIKCAEVLNKKEFVQNEIHPSAQISSNVLIPDGVKIGENCVLHSGVNLYPGVEIGSGTVLHSGVVVGSRGFGFYECNGSMLAVPHFGGVVIGENCEIGPNSVVAAGFLEATRLGNFCKLDSFVQIGHNCVVGNNVVFCSQSGLAGSVVVEDDVTLAGGAQVAGHLTLGKGCIVAAKAGVTKSVKPNAKVAGFPAIPIENWRKKMVT